VGARGVETGVRKVKGEENRSHGDGSRTDWREVDVLAREALVETRKIKAEDEKNINGGE
jgi:hypothetical protein